MKVNFRRLVSVFCSLAMCAALLPAAVLADDPAVAQMGDTTYPTLQAAVDAAGTDAATITLLDNTAETVTVGAGKNITLDLNGKTVTGQANAAVLVDGGSLTVQDSTVTAGPVVGDDYTVTYTSGVLEAGAGKHAVQVYNGGSFVLQSGTVSSTGNCGIYAGATGSGNGTATVNGGYVHAREYGVGAMNEGTTLNINGGVIVADDNAAVAGNGTTGLGGTTINIAGGTMISKLITSGYITCGVYHPQSGTLNITGGTIIARGTGEGKVGDSTVLSGHYGVLYDTQSGYPGLGTDSAVSVSGSASVSADDACVAVRTSVAEGENDRIVVSGGTFSKDVSDFVIDGNKTVDDGNGNWVLAPDETEAVAVYNGKGYMSLQSAIDAAGNGPATVSLVGDTTEAVTIPAGADITLDIAKKVTLTGTASDHAITNNGTLTVTGEGTVKAMAINKGAVENFGTANLKGANFTRNVIKDDDNWYVLDNQGTMNISDTANVFAEAPNASLIRNLGKSLEQKATLNISGGTITQNAFIAVKNDDYGALNITGGTINSTAQAVQSWHQATITGGTINGPVISWAYSSMPAMESTLELSGTAVVNGDVMSVTYDSVAVPHVTITGGTVNGKLIKGKPLSSGGVQALPNDSDMADIVVSGGTFNNAVPEEFCAENFHPNRNPDGSYSVHVHQFGPWVTTVQPGHTTSGTEVQTCTVCGYEIARTIAPTGNNDHPDIEQAKQDGTWGQATATPAPTATAAPASGSVNTVPQTGDEMPLAVLGGAAALAAAAMVVLILRKRRVF